MDNEEQKARKERKRKRKEKLSQAMLSITELPEIHEDCIVCGKPIKKGKLYKRLPPDSKHTEWRYYHEETCGPGTEAWYKFHPSRISKMMMESKEKVKDKRLERRQRRLLRKGRLTEGEVKPITLTQIQKEDITMAKKEEKKSKKGEHLIPMKPVTVPASILKAQPKEIRDLVGKLSGMERSSGEAAGIRKQLRKLGFKLSDYREGNGKEKPPVKKEVEATKKEKKSKTKTAPPEEE